MSKYNSLWEYVQSNVNHSFLKYKKELIDYGYEVEKISMKEQTIIFNKIG